ncbi:receptor-like protein EIX2 isoform X1 [Bidens hawaiensis]|uniref:receptor-like protein EIX2 isoform X1 n=1 Tax=Bidens hawaiensis TaxID=980011 RepID=UPI0040495E9E
MLEYGDSATSELILSGNILEGEMIGPTTNISECSQNALEILYLDHNGFNCSIPESLGRFINLRGLDLSFNEFKHVIHQALGKLRSLQRLDLSYNQLDNFIPESLGRLIALTELFLKSNRFTGPVPVSLGQLSSLRVLSLSSNLLDGTIPNSIGQLTKLYLLDVSNNSLQGVVSEDHFANLSMLKYLNADYNNKLLFSISREWIPPFELKVARLSSCKIEDEFPQWFRTQRKLKELVLTNASIFGPLPTWLHLLPIIHYLDLSHNKLTGSVTNLPSLYEVRYAKYSRHGLHLQDNLFSGLIPKWLCKMKDLEVLDLSRNKLTGKIPKCLWNLSLKVMLLSSNMLSGVIPSPLGYSSLDWLQLNDNNLSGELPQDLGYFEGLVVLDLGENKISGNIPERIGENISSLIILRLHKNNFTGRIPRSLCECFYLQLLDLAHNNLTGPIPHCFREFGAMKENPSNDRIQKGGFVFSSGNIMQVLKGQALEYKKTLEFVKNMDLSCNQLVGEIPEALTTLEALVGLNLSYNHFSGGIPKNIGNMKSLFSLDLSANKLTGMIPPSMAALNFLSYLNLSHNNLSGQIPTGNQLQTLTDPSIYAYNAYLCGRPLPKECFPQEKRPTTTSKNKHENGNEPKKVWFYLNIMSGFATGFCGIIGVLVFKKQWRHKLFMFSKAAMDMIYVAVAVRVLKVKRARVAA